MRGARGAADLLRVWLPLAAVFAHATSALWVSPELHAIRVAAGGAIGQLPAGASELGEFARLHSLSRGLFAIAAGSAASGEPLGSLAARFPARFGGFSRRRNFLVQHHFSGKNP